MDLPKFKSEKSADFNIKVAFLQDVFVRFYEGAPGHIVAVSSLLFLEPSIASLFLKNSLFLIGFMLVLVSIAVRVYDRKRIFRLLKIAGERKSRKLFARAQNRFYATLATSALGWGLFSYGLFFKLPSEGPLKIYLLIFLVILALIGATVACYNRKILIAYISTILFSPIYHFAITEKSLPIAVLLLLSGFYFYRFGSLYSKNLWRMIIRIQDEQNNKTQFHETLNALPMRFCVVENDRISFVNQNFADFVGRRTKELMNRSPKLLNSEVDSLIAECIKNDWYDLRRQILLMNSKFEMRWHVVAIHRLIELNTCIVAALDVHDQRSAELRDADNRARVEGASRMATIGQVSAGIAHEINNPLAIIIAKAERMGSDLKSLTAEQIQEGLKKIEKTGHRIAKIVRSLRALSRDGAHDPMAFVSIREVVEESLTLFEEKARSESVEIEVIIGADHFAFCRAVELSQTLTNLLGNALDAIQTNSVAQERRWLKIESHLNETMADIRVSNSGPKIPDAIADKIGTPFFTTKPAGHGTGLGLTISQRLIQENGGQLTLIRAAPFTTFSIQLRRSAEESKSAA